MGPVLLTQGEPNTLSTLRLLLFLEYLDTPFCPSYILVISLLLVYLVACQRGGVSNEPPGAATRHGDPLVRPQVDQTYKGASKNLKRTDRTPDSPYFY